MKSPIVISYYTESTIYEQEADGLRRSAIRFGLDYDIVPKPDMGGRKRNRYYKAQFVLEMLDKYPKRSVLWIDADADIIQYPTLFDNAKEDIGVFIVDWASLPGSICTRLWGTKPLTGIDLLSGTAYFANNTRSRAVVNAWVEMNKKNFDTTELEQINLHRVLKAWKGPLTIMYLPPSYCQIFDIMAHLGEPVIEHYQAGRRPIEGINL